MAGHAQRRTGMGIAERALAESKRALPPLPEDWQAKRVEERLEANLGCSADIHQRILLIPWEGATPLEKHAIITISTSYMHAAYKWLHDQSNRNDETRERILAALLGKFQMIEGKTE